MVHTGGSYTRAGLAIPGAQIFTQNSQGATISTALAMLKDNVSREDPLHPMGSSSWSGIFMVDGAVQQPDAIRYPKP